MRIPLPETLSEESRQPRDPHACPLDLQEQLARTRCPTQLKQFQEDKSRLRAVSYECPDNRLIDRGFRVVDESVSYGKAMSPAEFEALRNSRRSEPEVITYGHGDVKLNKRVIQEIKTEGGKKSGCCGGCCAGCGGCCGAKYDTF